LPYSKTKIIAKQKWFFVRIAAGTYFTATSKYFQINKANKQILDSVSNLVVQKQTNVPLKQNERMIF